MYKYTVKSLLVVRKRGRIQQIMRMTQPPPPEGLAKLVPTRKELPDQGLKLGLEREDDLALDLVVIGQDLLIDQGEAS